MGKLSKMSIENIIMEVGLDIYKNQIGCLLRDTNPLMKLNNSMEREVTAEEMIKFLIDNNDNIDKEKLVYIIAKNTKENMLKISNKSLDVMEQLQYQKFESYYQKCLNLLENIEVEFPVFEVKDGIASIKEFWTMEDLENDKRKPQKKMPKDIRQKNLKKLNEIDKQIPLECFFMIGSLSDFEKFVCYYKGNGPVFKNVVINNTSMLLVKFVVENEKKGRIVEEGSEEFENKKYMLLLEQAKKVLLDHPEKFDIDRFLLISAYRAKDLLESDNELAEEERKSNIRIMQIAHEFIENPMLKISGRIKTLYSSNYKQISYSKEMLKKDVKKIINDKYYSKAEISEEKRKIIEGEIDLEKVGFPEYLNILEFSKKEKRELIEKNPKNIEYLTILGELEPEQVQESLRSIENFKFDFIFLDSLYCDGVIDKRDIIDLYMKNNVDLSNAVNMNEEHDLQPEITIEELMRYYEDMKRDEEKTREFDRYRLLFRELKIKGKSPEVRDEMAEQIAMKVCEANTEYEDFKNLYEVNLLPIKTLIEWNDHQIVYELIKNRALKPKDTRSLLMAGELNLPKVYRTLQESDLSDEEKLNFIYSSFNGVGENPEEIEAQNEARMYLIQGLNISNEIVKIEKPEQITIRKTRNGNTKKVEGNRYVSDPIYRWQLFSELDEDCDIKLYKDGTAKVTLPNLNKVIIEKLFKHTKGSIKNNYGAATYIMSQEEFDRNKLSIIQDEKINRKVLIEMQEEGIADKLVHSSKWGKALKENLGISRENDYSQEKIERIDNLVDKIEKARELLD